MFQQNFQLFSGNLHNYKHPKIPPKSYRYLIEFLFGTTLCPRIRSPGISCPRIGFLSILAGLRVAGDFIKIVWFDKKTFFVSQNGV